MDERSPVVAPALVLEGGGFLVVAVLDGDENGVGDVAQITVAQHRTDDGVGRHVQIGAFEVHIKQDLRGVRIERLRGEDLFLPADLETDAGVHVKRDDGVDGVRVLVSKEASDSSDEEEAECGDSDGEAADSWASARGFAVRLALRRSFSQHAARRGRRSRPDGGAALCQGLSGLNFMGV